MLCGNWFQLFQPMGGVEATFVVCASSEVSSSPGRTTAASAHFTRTFLNSALHLLRVLWFLIAEPAGDRIGCGLHHGRKERNLLRRDPGERTAYTDTDDDFCPPVENRSGDAACSHDGHFIIQRVALYSRLSLSPLDLF